MKIFVLGLTLFYASVGFSAKLPAGKFKQFMQTNRLDRFDKLNMKTEGETKEDFERVVNQAVEVYKPLVAKYGAELTAINNWEDPTVNAYAMQESDTKWNIYMFGGLLRRPEVTLDGFALVVCHELGHHLAGYPTGGWWASIEGESDYFATQKCAHAIWKNDTEGNAKAREKVEPAAFAKCNEVYQTEADQNLCYRSSMAGLSLASLLAALMGSEMPKFDTPDQNVTESTISWHPEAQCRLDTYFSGAVCNKAYRADFIPGKAHPAGESSYAAELEAAANSCYDFDGSTVGTRPKCWFKEGFLLK